MSRFHSMHPLSAIRSMAKTIVSLAVASALAAGATANAMDNTSRQRLYQEYASKLEGAGSARDSLRILYNMFDLSSRQGQLKHSWDILHTAVNAEDINAQLDMLRTLATFNAGNDSIIDLLLKHADGIHNKAARESTRTYILNQFFARKNRHGSRHPYPGQTSRDDRRIRHRDARLWHGNDLRRRKWRRHRCLRDGCQVPPDTGATGRVCDRAARSFLCNMDIMP